MVNLKTKQRLNILILVICLLATLGLKVDHSSAQTSTVLTFDPDVVEVPLGNSVQLELWILEGVNVNAFDIELEYDADVLELTSWPYGDFLKGLADVMRVNDPGHFRLAATQLSQPAVSGSGVLLKFTFNTLSLGESLINLTTGQLSDAQGNSTFPALEDALVRVINAPTYPPISTQLPTQRPTPVWTATSLPTPTPTPTWTSQPSQTAARPSEGPQQDWPDLPADSEPGQGAGALPEGGDQPQSQNPLDGSGAGVNSSGNEAELALVPGYEQTAQVAHNATLMAQVEILQAGTLASNPQNSVETTLWVLLFVGIGILVVLLVAAVRRKQKQ